LDLTSKEARDLPAFVGDEVLPREISPHDLETEMKKPEDVGPDDLDIFGPAPSEAEVENIKRAFEEATEADFEEMENQGGGLIIWIGISGLVGLIAVIYWLVFN
jgi:hypothetical protein